MAEAGVHLVFGRPGGGKTTEVQLASPGGLVIATGKGNLNFFKQHFSKKDPQKYPLPAVEILIDEYITRWTKADGTIMKEEVSKFTPTGVPIPLHTTSLFNAALNQVTMRLSQARVNKEPPPYTSVTLDESGALWQRFFRELYASMLMQNDGKVDGRQVYGKLNDWTQNTMARLRLLASLGTQVFLVAHEQEPDLAKDKMGGPKFPSQNIMKMIAADCDSSAYRYIEDIKSSGSAAASLLDNAIPTPEELEAKVEEVQAVSKTPVHRLWRVHGSERWLCKMRGIPDEDFERVATMTYKEILTESGYLG